MNFAGFPDLSDLPSNIQATMANRAKMAAASQEQQALAARGREGIMQADAMAGLQPAPGTPPMPQPMPGGPAPPNAMMAPPAQPGMASPGPITPQPIAQQPPPQFGGQGMLPSNAPPLPGTGPEPPQIAPQGPSPAGSASADPQSSPAPGGQESGPVLSGKAAPTGDVHQDVGNSIQAMYQSVLKANPGLRAHPDIAARTVDQMIAQSKGFSDSEKVALQAVNNMTLAQIKLMEAQTKADKLVNDLTIAQGHDATKIEYGKNMGESFQDTQRLKNEGAADTQELRNAGGLSVANARVAGQLGAAGINAGARRYAADTGAAAAGARREASAGAKAQTAADKARASAVASEKKLKLNHIKGIVAEAKTTGKDTPEFRRALAVQMRKDGLDPRELTATAAAGR